MTSSVRIFFVAIFIGCSSAPVPSNILPPNKMQSVVYDLLRVDEFVNNFVLRDSVADLKMKRSILYAKVFKVNKTSRKEFYQSYKYYQQHPDLQKGLFDSLYESLNRKKIIEDTSLQK